MKNIFFLFWSFLFAFNNLFGQNQLEFGIYISPIQENLFKKISELEQLINNDVPYPIKSFELNNVLIVSNKLTYNCNVKDKYKLKNGVSFTVMNYEIGVNDKMIQEKQQNFLFNLYSGVERQLFRHKKNLLNLDFSIEIPVTGNLDFRFKDHTIINSAIQIDDEIRRVDFHLNNNFDNYSAPYRLSNFLSTYFSLGFNYLLKINEKSSFSFKTNYQTTLLKPFVFEYSSTWKRPGEDFFTKVEKTETSRFNFGFMNVGISYVYHFKKKEK
jgi:hypothetical protein